MTKEETIKQFQDFGYQFDLSNKFYEVDDCSIGVEVGRYTHSCHVDTTEFIVLLFIHESGETELDSFSDMWLKKI